MTNISAAEVFAKYAQSVPVFPDRIAKSMGIAVRAVSALGVSGAAYIDEGTQKKVILYNPLDAMKEVVFP